jgi:protein-S-isoprenylcysteine O-methyltransferase Ste14
MSLQEELNTQGNWLFRWRSYLPLLLILLVVVALRQFRLPFGSVYAHEIWEQICLAVSISGLAVRALAVAFVPARTSGRNAKCQVADELNTTGVYSVVRHPLYLGNFLIGLGISLVLWVWWLPVMYTLLFCLYYERIMLAEEAFLRDKFGREFEDWAARTPAFWPRLVQWRRPALPFSLRSMLRREYTALFVIVLGHTGLEIAEHQVLPHAEGALAFWIATAAIGSLFYVLLRTLKKRTRALDVPGR